MLEIILDEFHASTLWNGGIFIYTAFAVIIYFFLLPSSKHHSIWRIIAFLAGILAVYVSLGSPLNIIGRIKFSTHIIQLVLLLLIAPPLLIIGFKMEIIERIRKKAIVEKIIAIITKPIIAVSLFYVLFYVYHIPFVFNSIRLDLFLNYLAMLVLFIAAILVWIPLIRPNRLFGKRRWLYGLVHIILFIPYGAILLAANVGLYSLYTDIDLFMSSIIVCLPDAEYLTPEFYQSLLPFDPVQEQKTGGIYLLISQVVIFTLSTLLSSRKRSAIP
ncbi:cytochrome c oxidase assembly protein [Oceanobacillus senegalensis]|uniref:cytochrome c oxidase assembly protein n=1 Tax=Oceanobacillus senegalensis TaxID=1936063 RepID=UPI000A307579|nr:cytochrome c oxidase assembly protein [Oceanobacillus senegalensis]